MSALTPMAAKSLLGAVAENPARMRWLTSTRVREAILSSRDQAAAVKMMLRSSEILDLGEFVNDVDLIRSGTVSWQLLLARYPGALSIIGAIGLAMLLLLWRAVLGRRPSPPRSAQGT